MTSKGLLISFVNVKLLNRGGYKMAGTEEGGRKAAETRKEHDPHAFEKMGHAGAQARHSKSPEEESAIAKRAAQTRKEHDPEAFSKMGEKGGSAKRSHSHEEED